MPDNPNDYFHIGGGLAGQSGLPLEFSDNPDDIFYTTSEPLESLEYVEGSVSGDDVYKVDPLTLHINKEVPFPKGRLPNELYRSFMRQINSFLPPCTNEKRGHEFKHKRLRIQRSVKQKLANKPKQILTSECVYCKQHWSGLRYPLPEDERYPFGTSLFRDQRSPGVPLSPVVSNSLRRHLSNQSRS